MVLLMCQVQKAAGTDQKFTVWVLKKVTYSLYCESVSSFSLPIWGNSQHVLYTSSCHYVHLPKCNMWERCYSANAISQIKLNAHIIIKATVQITVGSQVIKYCKCKLPQLFTMWSLYCKLLLFNFICRLINNQSDSFLLFWALSVMLKRLKKYMID